MPEIPRVFFMLSHSSKTSLLSRLELAQHIFQRKPAGCEVNQEHPRLNSRPLPTGVDNVVNC